MAHAMAKPPSAQIQKRSWRACILFAALPAPLSPSPGEAQQISAVFSGQAGGKRSYVLVLPEGYDPKGSYRLAVVFAGTDTTGREMREWLGKGWEGAPGLEQAMKTTIFVYPDQKYRWDGDRGWALGPRAGEFGGGEDLAFTAELLASLEKRYAVDRTRIFATGHSWGGDMAAVAGCFLGDRFRAIAPIAANRPYWFGTPPEDSACRGQPAVWTVFGLADDHFGADSPNGAFGLEQNAFWMRKQSCLRESVGSGETRDFKGCASGVRLTLYAAGRYGGGGGLPGHQPPDWLPTALGAWFEGF